MSRAVVQNMIVQRALTWDTSPFDVGFAGNAPEVLRLNFHNLPLWSSTQIPLGYSVMHGGTS